MRTAHQKAHLLPLLLLSLHSVSVCLAASCDFDVYVKIYDLQHIATAKIQPTGQHWEPIRIVTSAKDIEGPPKYCEKKDGSIHERGSEGAGSDCTDVFATLTAEKSSAVKNVVAKAIELHTDRLLVQRAVDSLLIPDFSNYKRCKRLNVPAEHHTTGVANADMVLYIAAAFNTDYYGGAILGETCAKSAEGRPIAGGLVFGSGTMEINRLTVRFAAHHIAHALGFSYDEMNSKKMIVDKNVRSKTNSVAVVNSGKTKEMARAHYGCPTAEGMELEDGEENDKKLSHWERRNAKDELMAAPVGVTSTSFMGFYSNLTMAAFEDMGFYKANFQMAEHMEYGHKAGCGFLDDKCMENGVTKWPNMLCKESESDIYKDVCTTDRLGIGNCNLKDDYDPSLPEHFQYFASPNKGGLTSSLTDYCPVAEHEDRSILCTVRESAWRASGSLFSENSMCLDGNALHAKLSGAAVPVAAVCAEISCVGGSVKVKYLGDTTNKWHDCPEGQSITPSLTSDSFVSGTIKCPKYKEVCTIAPDGSSLVPKVAYVPMEPKTSTSPTAPPTASHKPKTSQDPAASHKPKTSQDPAASHKPKTAQDPAASHKPTGNPDGSKSSRKSKDSSSVPCGLIPSVAFLVLSFAGYLIA